MFIRYSHLILSTFKGSITMALTPAQVRSTWTWFGTGVSTLAKIIPKEKVVEEGGKAVIKVLEKVA